MSKGREYSRQMEGSVGNLIQCLKLLASNPEAQIEALPSYVSVPDELLLIYDDLYIMVDQFLEEGLIGLKEMQALNSLAQHGERITKAKDRNVMSNEALYTHPMWSRHRQLALEALSGFGVIGRTFTLDWLDYLPTDSAS